MFLFGSPTAAAAPATAACRCTSAAAATAADATAPAAASPTAAVIHLFSVLCVLHISKYPVTAMLEVFT